MSISNPDFLKHFGEIKFAEENSMCINDFELAIKRYLFGKEKKHRGSFKFGEIDNEYMKDFSRSFKKYFE
ncbi:MAG: hypothetical protein KAX18_09525 [Candidatus Lokiarchaeota archaeon]|nr:hypothetical protein [Candidatus Lokiarchaeota archaeon]